MHIPSNFINKLRDYLDESIEFDPMVIFYIFRLQDKNKYQNLLYN